MRMAEQIEDRLRAAFAPDELQVVDQSHLHKGHAGAPEGGESHFRVRMVSAAFTGKSRIARQRAVLDALKPQMEGGIHALSMTLSAPGEGR